MIKPKRHAFTSDDVNAFADRQRIYAARRKLRYNYMVAHYRRQFDQATAAIDAAVALTQDDNDAMMQHQDKKEQQ